MPQGGVDLRPRKELLSFDEIATLAEIFVDLGIRKIRLTGGEPLVRKGVAGLCTRLSEMPGVETLGLTTNGVRLFEMARALRESGVHNLNVSLDTLRRDRFQLLALRTAYDNVLHGINEAHSVGFPSLKMNTVVMRGFNDDEILEFVEFADARALNVRFIEYMPFLGNGWNEVQFISYSEMKKIIESKFSLIPVKRNGSIQGPAKEFQVAGSNAIIGFITTMSEHFCAACNRLRLTADGKLRNCLFAREEIDLKRLLRAGASRDVIEDSIRAAVILKWERHPDVSELTGSQNRSMISIGG
jgi:cyclic pyranopterin phosphate synthase